MQALVVIDVQNEFSPAGKRAVPSHRDALAAIQHHVDEARKDRRPIAWIRHYNKPHESAAFVPGTWGSELSPGSGPRDGFGPEALFEKDVFGAFTTTTSKPGCVALAPTLYSSSASTPTCAFQRRHERR